jgi:hypothetical protein
MQQCSREAVITFKQGAGYEFVGRRGGHRIGEFIRMQDGPSTGRTADNLPASLLQSSDIHIRERLGISKREAGGVPGVQPESGRRFAATGVLEDGFINGHVPGAMRR